MGKELSYKRRLPAGVFDAGFASLATFAAGLAAVNLLGDTDRGVYAVFFTVFMLGTVLPRNLIFTPAEVHAVSLPLDSRLLVTKRSLFLGLGPAVVGAFAILIAVAVTWSYSSPDVVLALALTTAIATILSPLQDHVRKMLHIAARSWRSATVSIVQFIVVVVSIGVMMWLDVAPAWISFGSLSIANAISLPVSLLLLKLDGSSAESRLPALSVLISRGKWLVLQAAAPAILGFAVAAIVAELAGPAALGFAEAARVVAQPILVLAAGLTAVLAPRSVEAGIKRDEETGKRTNLAYLAIIGVAGLGYLAVAGWDWVLNPMAYIVPPAYVVPGLAALTIVANILTAGVYLQINELLGGHREKLLARISWTTSPILLLGGLSAGFTGAYSRALGRVGESIARYVVQRLAVRDMYQEEPDDDRDGDQSRASTGADRE